MSPTKRRLALSSSSSPTSSSRNRPSMPSASPTSAGQLGVRAGGVDLQERGVVVRVQRPGDRIGQPLLIADLIVEPRRHPVVEHAHQRPHRQVVGIGLRERVKQDVHLRLRRLVVHGVEAGPHPGRTRRPRHPPLAARHAREGDPTLALDGAQLDRAGDGEHHVRGAVEAAEVRAHVARREATHVLERPGDRKPERVLAPDLLARLVVDVHVAPAVVEVFENLLDDDLALEIDVLELRRAEQIAEDLHPALKLPRVQRDLIERVVAPGLGVEGAAQLLDRQVQRERRRVARRPPEQHVLQKVRDPVRLGPFVT